MRLLLSTFIISFALFSIQGLAITDGEIAEITERVEAYSTDELVERRQVLLAMLDVDEDDVTATNADMEEADPEVRKRLLFELSIVETILLALGVIVAGDVTDSTATPPDTIFPVISILGPNPATVELGSAYVDAGATTNEGTISVISNNVNINAVGSYSVVYSATDASGNTSTATRAVNVVDTTAPVVTASADNRAKEE